MHDGRRVRGLTVFQRRLEVNLFGSMYRRIIQTVTEPANDSQHAQFAGRFKNNFEKNLAFNLLLRASSV